ncbi:MAG TPA: uroporphyrinogen-III C-methyltransferase [Chitinophagaceae bacterium]|nr:uroporphyrinogen-III C-methyltransferase [Chitinophagaceae bacterium]
MNRNENNQKGKVVLAGAGPGDPELISVKAARYLQRADVVLTDRLVSPEILEEYVRPETELVYVGKQCRRGASTPQETINELMVRYASAGKLVVRLKGGDVSVFSNILDELQVLVQAAIPYEIIPGISAALGAAAYAGIPLTARGYSTAIRFLTYYKSDVVTDAYWKELAVTEDTLVFYMSSETLGSVVDHLLRQGRSPDTRLAVIEQATTPLQQVHTVSLQDYAEAWKDRSFRSPSLVIIGKTVALHEQFAWMPNAEGGGHYFEPLSGSIKHLLTPNNETAYAGRA